MTLVILSLCLLDLFHIQLSPEKYGGDENITEMGLQESCGGGGE